MEKWEVISYTANALTFAGITFLILVYLNIHALSLLEIILLPAVCILFATLLPLGYIYLFVNEKRKTNHDYLSYDISDKNLRFKPFTVSIISYLLGTTTLFILGAPTLIKGLMFCYLANAIIVMAITFYWKISVHTAGIAGPLTVLVYKLGVLYLPIYLIVLPVGIARIKLKEHSPLQVVAGALLIILTTWIQLNYIIVPYF